jgi:hypothetical protein
VSAPVSAAPVSISTTNLFATESVPTREEIELRTSTRSPLTQAILARGDVPGLKL